MKQTSLVVNTIATTKATGITKDASGKDWLDHKLLMALRSAQSGGVQDKGFAAGRGLRYYDKDSGVLLLLINLVKNMGRTYYVDENGKQGNWF